MKFKIGENNIMYLSSNFKECFEDIPVEEGTTLINQKLPRNMSDSEILAELKPTEVSLGDVYETLKTMDKSWCGIFYVKDKENVLRAVYVFWDCHGWDVGVVVVSFPLDWDAVDRVFSRNPFGSQTLNSPDSLTLGNLDTLPEKLTINGIIYVRE